MTSIKILFVCTGNICRSPTAEGVLRKLAHAAGLSWLEVDSAGTHDYHAGKAPDPRAIEVAKWRGYDLSGLRARTLQIADFDRFDLILAMDFSNLRALEELSPPAYRNRLGMLMSYASHSTAIVIRDPYCRDLVDFERALDCIEDACSGLVDTFSQRDVAVNFR